MNIVVKCDMCVYPTPVHIKRVSKQDLINYIMVYFEEYASH